MHCPFNTFHTYKDFLPKYEKFTMQQIFHTFNTLELKCQTISLYSIRFKHTPTKLCSHLTQVILQGILNVHFTKCDTYSPPHSTAIQPHQTGDLFWAVLYYQELFKYNQMMWHIPLLLELPVDAAQYLLTPKLHVLHYGEQLFLRWCYPRTANKSNNYIKLYKLNILIWGAALKRMIERTRFFFSPPESLRQGTCTSSVMPVP